ncbi:MAG: cation diffusion facilitator family transporter [Planctomycetota bacterium]
MTARAGRGAAYDEAIAAAWLGLVVNLFLGAGKLLAGWLANSFALLSDAINSWGDVFTSIVILFALRFAQRPPDEEHPYGHSRAEAIAASNVALLVLLSALGVGYEAIRRLGMPHPLPPFWTIGVALANVLIKECLYQYKVRVGRRINSAALLANAWDHRSDAFCSAAVLIGLLLVRWGGPAWISADEVAALFVVVAIVWSAGRLFYQSLIELMDVQADSALVDQIRTAANSVPGVAGVEKLWVRKSGIEYFVDIHIEVDPQLTVAAGHRIGHAVKDDLLNQFHMLRDVLVHLEPYGE